MAQLERLKIFIPDEDNDGLLQELLNQAGDAIKQRRRTPTELPMESQYSSLQIEIAVFLYNKLGAEGENNHSENGVNRSYENAHIPDSMLNMVVPLGVVIK